jgi:hypothetical protein
VLGSSVPGTSCPVGYKGVRSLECPRAGYLASGRLQCPIEKHVSTWWKTCGRREREDDADAGGAIFTAFRIATVEGTSVFWMAPSFAGRRRNEGLGRSGSRSWVSSHGLGRADDNEVSSGRRGGERCRHARKCACTRRGGFRPLFIVGDASFARSRDPCSSIVTQRRRREPCSVTRSMGYRGRANLREQEEPAPGSQRTGVARLAAWSPLPKGRQRGTSEKEGGCGLRPCEETRARACARTS